MATYVNKSVPRPAGNPVSGIALKDKIVIIDTDDIETFPARDEAGVVIAEAITLKASAKPVYLYLTPGTVEVTSTAEGEPDAMGFNIAIKGNHPGNSQEVREFKWNWLGRKCIIIVQYCDGTDADLLGTPCNPMQMSSSFTATKDMTRTEFSFASITKGMDIAIYQGEVPTETPAVSEDS